MKRHPLIFINAMLLLFLVMLMPPHASSNAQQRLGQGGHALDSNLKLGSNGYNRSRANTSRGLKRSRYSVGSSRALYTVNRNGTMSHNPHNAFAPRSRYRSTGYTGRTFSNKYQQRFRYGRSTDRR